MDVDNWFTLWPDSDFSGQSVRRVDSDFVTCPMFHWIGQTDHKLVRASLRLANRPSLAGYWKLKFSLLDIRGFLERLETLIQRALAGAATGNKWWGSLKFRIWDFAIKYGQQLKLNRTKMTIGFPRRWRGGDILAIDLARRDLELKTSERYKGSVVRSRLKRVPNEAMKCNAFTSEEKAWFPHQYIEFVKSPDGHALRSNRETRVAFRAHFHNRFARCPGLPVQEFHIYLADLGRSS